MNRRPAANAPAFATRADRPEHRPEVNPYRDGHRSYGPGLIPAEDAPAWKGRWHENFGRSAPIHLELGLGNGRHLGARAAANPNLDFVGLEIRYKRCVVAAERAREAGAEGRVRVVRYSWFSLGDLFADGELAGIHVYHPDPWERGRQAKHRLIEPGFVQAAARLVAPGGELRLKTDFKGHFDALLKALPGTPWQVQGSSLHVARDGAPWPDDIVTGYQAKFNEKALPVYAAWLRRGE